MEQINDIQTIKDGKSSVDINSRIGSTLKGKVEKEDFDNKSANKSNKYIQKLTLNNEYIKNIFTKY